MEVEERVFKLPDHPEKEKDAVAIKDGYTKGQILARYTIPHAQVNKKPVHLEYLGNPSASKPTGEFSIRSEATQWHSNDDRVEVLHRPQNPEEVVFMARLLGAALPEYTTVFVELAKQHMGGLIQKENDNVAAKHNALDAARKAFNEAQTRRSKLSILVGKALRRL